MFIWVHLEVQDVLRIAITHILCISLTVGEDYCVADTFEPTCSSSTEVVVIDEAYYGRMKMGRCIHHEDRGGIG